MTGLLYAWRNWRQRGQILRELRRGQADSKERSRFAVRDDLTEALSALELNDRRKASEIWASSMERYPAETRTSPLTLEILLKLRRYDEAETLMRENLKKYPREIYFAKGLAEIAQTRGDHDAAIEHYATLRKLFPGVATGYVLGAQSLAAKHRFDEAGAMVTKAMEQFPNEIGGFLEYARLPVRREDWPDALARWTIVGEKFPDRVFGFYGRAQALIKLERYDEADEVLAAARFRFPTESGLLAEQARCAQARGDLPEAIKRWKHRVERMPMETYGYNNAAAAFEEMAEYAEAEAMLRAAVERFPAEEGPLIALGKFLHERQDYAREAQAWADLRQAFPENEEAFTRGANALRHAGDVVQATGLLHEHKNQFKR